MVSSSGFDRATLVGGECSHHCATLLLLGGVILILIKPTSDNEDSDIIKIVKENGRQETRGQLESLRSP